MNGPHISGNGDAAHYLIGKANRLCPSTMLRMVPLPVPGRIGNVRSPSQTSHSRSEHHLRACSEAVDAIAAVVPGRDDRVANLQPRIVDHETHITDRVPNQRSHIAVLSATNAAVLVEIARVVKIGRRSG